MCSPEKSNFQREAEIIKEAFPGWSERIVASPIDPAARTQISIDRNLVVEELGMQYRTPSRCFVPFAKQPRDRAVKEGLLAL